MDISIEAEARKPTWLAENELVQIRSLGLSADPTHSLDHWPQQRPQPPQVRTKISDRVTVRIADARAHQQRHPLFPN